MADPVLYQAMLNITSFGRRASPIPEEQQSTQYTDAFNEIIQSELDTVQVQGPVSSSGQNTANPTGATSIIHSPTTKDTSNASISNAQATAAPTVFSISRAMDTSPAHGFSFHKAIMPTFNTKPTRGPAAVPHQKDEQQSTNTNPIPTAVSNITPTTVKIPATSKSENPSQHCGSNHSSPEPHEVLWKAKLQPPTPPIQQSTNTEQLHTNESEKRAVPKPYHTSSSSLAAANHVATIQTIAAGLPGLVRQTAEQPSRAPSTYTDDTRHDEDTTMLDGPTLIYECPASRPTSHTSSRSSSQSSFQSRSFRTLCRTPSNRSCGYESSHGSVLSRLQALSKVHKRHASPGHRSSAVPETSRVSASKDLPIDPEDLLKALTIHYHEQKQQRAQFKMTEKAKDEDITTLEMIIKDLDGQLKESDKQISEQEAKLRRYSQLVPGWQDRIKKLSDFVKGLNNDHARLRDDARSIQDEQQKIMIHKENMDKVLRESAGALEKERADHRQRLIKAHHRTEKAEQALNTSNIDLLGERTRVRAEQDRNTSLQDSLTRLTSDREDILVKLGDQEATICSKIANLDVTIADSARNASTRAQEGLNPKLEECISLLKEPRTDDSANAEDVRKLDISIKENGDKISQLAHSYKDTISATSRLEDRIVSEVDSRLQSIVASIEAGQPLEQQLQDLQESNAKFTERLKATEADLADSRHKLTTAEKQEKEQLQKTAALEAEVKALHGQPRESPLLALRLHDSEKQCEELNQQLSAYQLQLEATRSDLAAECLGKASLEESLQTAKADIVGLQAKVEAISLEKVAVEGQAKLNEDKLREDLSKSCNNEISRNKKKFVNEIHRLRNVEKDLEASRAEIALLEGTKGDVLAKLDTATRDLESRQASASEVSQMLQKSLQECSRLEKDLEGIRNQDAEKSKHFQEMETEIRQMREGTSSMQKDLEVEKRVTKELKAEKAAALENAKIAEASANSEHQLLMESRNKSSQLEQEVASLNQKVQTLRIELDQNLPSMHTELADIQKDRAQMRQENLKLRTLLDQAEEEKTRLRDQNKATDGLLASATQKLNSQEARIISKSMQEQAATPKANPQPSSVSKRLPEKRVEFTAGAQKQRPENPKKAVVVEDSQNTSEVIEESQNHGLDLLREQQGRTPSKALGFSNPIAFMPKAIQDLVAAPSSPLTDCQPTSIPVTDGREMFPPSPSLNAGNRGRIIEDSQATTISSQELGSSHETPSQRSVWALSTSTTKTKLQSVERIISKTGQPTTNRKPHLHAGGQADSLSSAAKRAAQPSQPPPGILKSGGAKGLASSQNQSNPFRGNNKRRKLSGEISAERELPNLGPTKASPVNPAGTSRRKSTLRRSQRTDKYHDRFLAELEKGQ
ncbi:MAG: hypothetical protein Q9178_007887 [Gyalolechia marmorata]